ncbi:MAG: sugar ABC transporter permease, partial [Clostridiales bacterium]|nr:sugar ABC transporter permease [Clostridiales bacterium]
VLLDVSKIFRGNFDLFYQLISKNGALYNATDVIDTFVFRALIQSSDTGMAAAAGLYQSVLCFVTIMVVNTAVRRINTDYALF